MYQEYLVLLNNRDRVENLLKGLIRRAVRHRLPPGQLTWVWGKAFSREELHPRTDGYGGVEKQMVDRIPLVIEGKTPQMNGYTFVASLEHTPEGNIVRSVPGEETPVMYRSAGGDCDHCHVSRNRNNTYVVREDATGKHSQIGSSCLADFFGSDSALRVAAAAELFASLSGIDDLDDEEEFGSGGGYKSAVDLARFLAYTAMAIQRFGWVSAKVASMSDIKSTAVTVWEAVAYGEPMWEVAFGEPNPKPSQECVDIGEETSKWAENMSEEDINASGSDYLYNLRLIGRLGYVTSRSSGLAASMVVARQRALEPTREQRAAKEKPVTEYVGAVGEKVVFGKPPKKIKGAVVISEEPVRLDFVTGFDTEYGYTTILKFRSDDGRLLVWKTSSTSLTKLDVGKMYMLAGTVKSHSEFRGEKETALTRCGVTEVL